MAILIRLHQHADLAPQTHYKISKKNPPKKEFPLFYEEMVDDVNASGRALAAEVLIPHG
jgi:hypothetical protein